MGSTMLARPERRHRRRARPAPRRGDRIVDTVFFVEGGGLVHVVTGSNGENMIRARCAPRCVAGRSTGSWRAGCCRGGLGRRCRAGDRCARPGQPLRDHRVLDRIRQHFRFQRTLRGCRSFSRSSRPRTGPSATDRPSRPQADLRSGSRAWNLEPLSCLPVTRPRGSLRGRLCWCRASQGGLSGPYPCAGADRPRLTPLGRTKAPTARLAKAPPRRPSSPPAGAARRRPRSRRWRQRRGGPRRRLPRRRGE